MLTVLDVDCGATLHGHVKHVDVVVHNHDVGHGTPVRVGKVAVAALKLMYTLNSQNVLLVRFARVGINKMSHVC